MPRVTFKALQAYLKSIGWEFEKEVQGEYRYCAWNPNREPGVERVYKTLNEVVSELDDMKRVA